MLAGGEGATAREVLRHKSVEEVIMVDIDKVAFPDSLACSADPLHSALIAALPSLAHDLHLHVT